MKKIVSSPLRAPIGRSNSVAPVTTLEMWCLRQNMPLGHTITLGHVLNLLSASAADPLITDKTEHKTDLLHSINALKTAYYSRRSQQLFYQGSERLTQWTAIIDRLRSETSTDGFDLSNLNLSGLKFENCTLLEVNFAGCQFKGVTFKNVALKNCTFQDRIGGDLSGVKFDKHTTLQNCPLTHVTLDRPVLKSLYNGGHRDFCGANLTGADLRGLTLTDANFEGGCLSAARFEKSTLVRANFKGVTLASPPAQSAPYTPFLGCNITHALLNEAMFNQCVSDRVRDFSGTTITDAKTNQRIRGLNFNGATLSGCQWTDCHIEGNTFSGTKFTNCTFTGATLSRNTYANTIAADADPGTFKGAKLTRQEFISLIKAGQKDFAGANLSGVNLTKLPLLGELNLTDVNLENTILDAKTVKWMHCCGRRDFKNVHLKTQNFTRFPLCDCDFSGAHLYAVTFDPRGINTINFSNATFDTNTLKALRYSGRESFTNLDFRELDIRKISFQGCQLTNVDVSYDQITPLIEDEQYKLSNFTLSWNCATVTTQYTHTDVLLETYLQKLIDVGVRDFTGSDWRNVNLRELKPAPGLKLNGIQIEDATLDAKWFRLFYNSGHRDFYRIRMRDAHLKTQPIENCNFAQATLSGVQFGSIDSCNFEGASLQSISFKASKGPNLRASEIDGETFQNLFDGGCRAFSSLQILDLPPRMTLNKFRSCTFERVVLSDQMLHRLLQLGVTDFRGFRFHEATTFLTRSAAQALPETAFTYTMCLVLGIRNQSILPLKKEDVFELLDVFGSLIPQQAKERLRESLPSLQFTAQELKQMYSLFSSPFFEAKLHQSIPEMDAPTIISLMQDTAFQKFTRTTLSDLDLSEIALHPLNFGNAVLTHVTFPASNIGLHDLQFAKIDSHTFQSLCEAGRQDFGFTDLTDIVIENADSLSRFNLIGSKINFDLALKLAVTGHPLNNFDLSHLTDVELRRLKEYPAASIMTLEDLNHPPNADVLLTYSELRTLSSRKFEGIDWTTHSQVLITFEREMSRFMAIISLKIDMEDIETQQPPFKGLIKNLYLSWLKNEYRKITSSIPAGGYRIGPQIDLDLLKEALRFACYTDRSSEKAYLFQLPTLNLLMFEASKAEDSEAHELAVMLYKKLANLPKIKKFFVSVGGPETDEMTSIDDIHYIFVGKPPRPSLDPTYMIAFQNPAVMAAITQTTPHNIDWTRFYIGQQGADEWVVVRSSDYDFRTMATYIPPILREYNAQMGTILATTLVNAVFESIMPLESQLKTELKKYVLPVMSVPLFSYLYQLPFLESMDLLASIKSSVSIHPVEERPVRKFFQWKPSKRITSMNVVFNPGTFANIITAIMGATQLAISEDPIQKANYALALGCIFGRMGSESCLGTSTASVEALRYLAIALVTEAANLDPTLRRQPDFTSSLNQLKSPNECSDLATLKMITFIHLDYYRSRILSSIYPPGW